MHGGVTGKAGNSLPMSIIKLGGSILAMLLRGNDSDAIVQSKSLGIN